MMIVQSFTADLIQWFFTLDRPFVFLLALPFVVGFAGLLAEYLRRRSTVRDLE